jgi:hypothetical protein
MEETLQDYLACFIKVKWNPNASHSSWLAAGTAAGLVELLGIP